MFKYIGIRGHRGAGKNTFSYLLGVAIDYYTTHNSFDRFEECYEMAVDDVMEGSETFLCTEFDTIFFESFADTAKVMLTQLTGIPNEAMYDDWSKDSIIVNMNDFSHVRAQDKLALRTLLLSKQPLTAHELYTHIENGNSLDGVHITLRELIAYFSKYVMQTHFGQNVWIKSLEANKWDIERFYDSKKTIYKIFTDCKFPSEISYIKNNNGIIIKVNRANNVKEDTEISHELANDNRFDYEINWDGELMSKTVIDDIKRLTLKIIGND